MAARGKKMRTYPTYNEMVVTAITELKQQTGSSFKDISMYLPEKYSLPEGYEIQVKKALGRQLKKKRIIKIKEFFKIKEDVAALVEKSVPVKDRSPMEVQPKQIVPKRTAAVNVKKLVPGKERTGEIVDKSLFSSSKEKSSSVSGKKRNRTKATVKKTKK